jgi:hypothetical protein
LAYSFETGTDANPDGFTQNGPGMTMSRDTIGATQGTSSLKFSQVGGATYTGALNQMPDLNVINNPPGIDHILFDMTIVDPFAGAFANVFVKFFAASQPGPGQQTGLEVVFADFEHIDGKAAGTYHDIRLDLTDGTNPITFDEHQSFNQIFGPTGLIPTGVQITINKSGDAPLTAYFDNFRVGMSPAAVPGDYNGNGVVDMADYVLWRNGGPLQNEIADVGTVSAADYTAWRGVFGNTSGSGSGSALSSIAVPEPTTAMLILATTGVLLAARRKHAVK